MDIQQSCKPIIKAYANVLSQEDIKPLDIVPSALPETLLPYPKLVIRVAITFLLLVEFNEDRRGVLEESYLSLNYYIPDDEFNFFQDLEQSLNKTSKSETPAENSSFLDEQKNKIESKRASIEKRLKLAKLELRALRRIVEMDDNLV